MKFAAGEAAIDAGKSYGAAEATPSRLQLAPELFAGGAVISLHNAVSGPLEVASHLPAQAL
jgi:hypothetical protein